jgi:molybdate transport system substrate-binding protein
MGCGLIWALVLAACGAAPSPAQVPSSLQGSITVFAAASLSSAFGKIGADFQRTHRNTNVHFSFAGSAALVAQIEQGALTDVIASADQANMQKLVDSDLLEGSPSTFARNRLEVVVAPGNPRHISALSDLSRSGLIVVLCAPAVPCGHYGNQALQKAGVSLKAASLETDVKGVVSKVSLGEADAGIVYTTDVKAAGSRVQGIEIPDQLNVIAAYPIGLLKDSQNVPLAKAFIGYVLANSARDRDGQATLRQYGFLGP